MRETPKVRKDGRCRTCKGPRRTDRQKGVPEQVYATDPFCSATCARKWYGTELAGDRAGRPPTATK